METGRREPSRICCLDRQEWLEHRRNGLGASDAAAVMGLSPWCSNLQLWLEKTGQAESGDISAKESVALGISLEGPVREIFRIKHPEYELEHHAFDILYQPERPWLTATLDGELRHRETGARGVYEGKTSTISRRGDWQKWNGRVPDNYYCQVCHQMLATGWDFVWLVAFLLNLEGDRCEYREYLFLREDCREDMEAILEPEEKFWDKVLRREMPPMRLNF